MLSFFYILLLSVYLSFLTGFGFVSHPLGYCFLLVGGALCLSLASILSWGFSWYLVLFILVYVGGVYVLFLFVSVHSANSFPALGGNLSFYFLGGFSFFILLYSTFYWFSFIDEESRFLCSSVEGFSYLVLCFTLLFGFLGVSAVSSQKDSFFR